MPEYNYKPIEFQEENMLNQKQEWYKPKIDPKLLKNLSKRTDGPGWVNTIAFFATLFITGYLAFILFSSSSFCLAICAFFSFSRCMRSLSSFSRFKRSFSSFSRCKRSFSSRSS